MNNIQLSKLLEKYVNGNCTPEETAVIDQWYKKYANIPGYLDTLPANQRQLLKSKMLNSIMNKVSTDADNISANEIGKVVPFISRWWFRLSAAAVFLLLIKVFVWDGWINAYEQQAGVAQTQVLNNTRVIIKQLLPDGSAVWLKPNASLTFPKAFEAASRNVVMKGQCFFEITKNPQRPFIINSKHMIIKVWGTSFEVSDFDNAQQATVTVLTGKVSVSKKGSAGDKAGARLATGELMLKPEQKAIYTPMGNVLIADTKTHMVEMDLWKHIDLSFDNAKLVDIVKVLNQKFKVNIQVADPQLYTASMTADLTDFNLPEVLEVLKTSMKIEYEITNDLITLKKPIN